MTTRRAVLDAVDTARGRAERADPVLPGSGGPAGNATLTARLGLALLTLFVAELVTLLNVRGLLNWHVGIGLALVPPALAKSATTGWRVVRYYAGSTPYRSAGAPPLLLRLLGPVVVATTLALLGTGTALLLLGPDRAFPPFLTVLGFAISPLTLHQVSFFAWAAATGLHVLGRAVSAWRLAAGRSAGTSIAGAPLRAMAVLTVAGAAVALAAVALHLASSWHGGGPS